MTVNTYHMYRKCSFIILFLIVGFSCKEKDESKTMSSLAADTNIVVVERSSLVSAVDSADINEKSKGGSSLKDNRNKNLPIVVGRKNLLHVLKSAILFDGDFNPYFFTELHNNARYSIVGLQFIVYPNKEPFSTSQKDDCDITIRKKITILPNEGSIIKERINSPKGRNCDFNKGTIVIDDVVYSNGKRIRWYELSTGDTSLRRL